VTASGKFEPWPAQVWVDAPGIVFKATGTKGKFDVEVAPDAMPGPHLVRIFTAGSVSAPCFFIVSRDPELRDTEPNDDFAKPQKMEQLPATIRGRLDKAGDVDSFSVTLNRGQSLVARADAYVL
jgi:hypothetical protein